MQKFYCWLSCLFLSLSATAQVQWAAFAGPQVTNAHYTVRDAPQATSSKPGLIAGGGIKVPFDNHLFFFPSMYYSLKGYKVDLKDAAFPPSTSAINNTTTIHTVEISPMFQIDFNRKPAHPFVRFGPAIDIAISGKERFDSLDANGSGSITPVSRSMVFSFGDYGRFSASVNLHLGYESSRQWMVYGFYAHGIGSMNNADNGPKIFHRIYGVALGWLFAAKNGR